MFFKPTLYGERLPGGRVRVTPRWRGKRKLPSGLGLRPWVLSEGAFRSLETNWCKKGPPPFLEETLPPFDFPVPLEAPFDRLLPHQREGVESLLGGKRLLCDEMGVGKTMQALAFASILQRHLSWTVGVVCPSYLKEVWRRAAEGWVEVEVHSYSLMARRPERYDLYLLDEAHYIKSPGSKRSKVLRKLCRKAHALLLTGTPQKNRPNEIWSLLNALKLGPTWGEWVRRYCDAKKNPFGGMDTRGASLQGEMWAYLEGQMVRRRSLEVLSLPEKQRALFHLQVPLSGKMRGKFKRWKEINRAELTERSERERKKLIMELYILTGEAKIPFIAEYLRGVEGPFLVFGVHVKVLESLGASFPGDSWVLHGGVPAEERQACVDRFQRGEGRCLFLSIGACSTGLTITRASRVIFAEWPFSPGDLEQAEARAWRLGQTSEVEITYLHAEGTLDTWLVRSLRRKASLQT